MMTKSALLAFAAFAAATGALAGNVQIQVLDRDGKPVPDAVVVVYPRSVQVPHRPSWRPAR